MEGSTHSSLPDFREMTRREIEDYLIEKSSIDHGFRDRLISEPVKVLKELGLPVGDQIEIRVIEEGEKSFTIVLPRVLKDAAELDDLTLEGIAGGQSGSTLFFKGYF